MRIILFLILLLSQTAFAQITVIAGKIINEQNESLEGVNIQVLNSSLATKSSKDGLYELRVSGAVDNITLVFNFIGYRTQTVKIGNSSQNIVQNITLLRDANELNTVVITGRDKGVGNMNNIDMGLIQNNPSVSGNFESLLKTLPGVSTNNELSSQYSVRGGNFDENLIYVNDVEIFRPLLVRNGQQEGLSFINPELVTKASFSAGGFEARYGDKLSSVLDIKYGRPDSNQITTSLGLLGLSATAKQAFKNSYLLIGARNKTNQNILKTQQIKGAFQPKFFDVQALYNVNFSGKLSLTAFADYNLSQFSLVPESRETIFGTISQQYKLNINYEGQEKDLYQSLAGAFTLNFKPNQNLGFKWINSVFRNTEQETFDIEGSYIFDESSSSNLEERGNVKINRGIGVNYEYARNFLRASVFSSEIRASLQQSRSYWETGIRYQHDKIDDRLNEYQVIDSAGYTLPVSNGSFLLTDVSNATNTVTTNRFTAFIQNTFSLNTALTLSAGLRSNFNTYTNEFFLSPRISMVYRKSDNPTSYWFSSGSYNQPPFYREFRTFNGSLNSEAKAQRSIHLLAAADHSFKNSGAKFTSEVYYKVLSNLTPYKIENLRIRYFADQESKGYAAGADFAISKEFVSGLESSFRISFMKTAEDIKGDSYQTNDKEGNSSTVFPGYLKRPTDQRINFSTFFQDRLFNSPSYKVHLTALYGSALSVGPPRTQRAQDVFRIPAYKRVDIAFSKDFLEGRSKERLTLLNRYFDSFIAYAEVFNLLNINNTVSYLWIRDVNNNQFAVPNYLTSRQLNIKFIARIKN
jgi:hypothetical protein